MPKNGIEPLKRVLTVPRNNHSAMIPKLKKKTAQKQKPGSATPIHGRRDSNTLYISHPKGATNQFVIYHLYL